MSPIIFALVLGASAQAGYDTHGGDTREARELRIQDYILEDLKSDLKDDLESLSDFKMKDPAMQTRWAALAKFIPTDLGSRYATDGGCVANGETKSASAGLKEVGGTICFDPKILADENASNLEIQALAIHEHAHHAGFGEKTARAIQAEVLAYLEKLDAEETAAAEVYNVNVSNNSKGFFNNNVVVIGEEGSGAHTCRAKCRYNARLANSDYHPESSWWDRYFGSPFVIRAHSFTLSSSGDSPLAAFQSLADSCKARCVEAQEFGDVDEVDQFCEVGFGSALHSSPNGHMQATRANPANSCE